MSVSDELLTQLNRILCVMCVGPWFRWMVEAFPIEARYSAVAIGYNGAHALIGGFVLLVATALAENVSLLAPCGMLFVVCSVSTAVRLRT